MTKRKDTDSVNTVGDASFRDPAGFMFEEKGELCRFVTKAGAADYDATVKSGLFDVLFEKGLLVSHEVLSTPKKTDAYAVLKPTRVPFITYPFEWSFEQLKDAALLTLKIQKLALKHGMTLKDASAYNVQFLNGKPIFIDTLSFEPYTQGEPWQAYRQFCQHFLAPLALMAYTDVRLSQLLRTYIDGVPLDLATKLLPARAKLRPALGMHIVLHGRAQKAKQSDTAPAKRVMSKDALLGVLESLWRSVQSLQPRKAATEWGDYYSNTNYTKAAADAKAQELVKLVKPLKAKTALDLGGNDGTYSRALHKLNIETVCTDIDPNAVQANYLHLKHAKETAMLPVVIDLTNPGGGLGWANAERATIAQRFQTDVVMVLALVHHLAISNNLPLDMIARYLTNFAPNLVIEFVPKSDSQVKKLLATRRDIFPNYHEDGLKEAFAQHFTLKKEVKIKGTKRTLYLFERK